MPDLMTIRLKFSLHFKFQIKLWQRLLRQLIERQLIERHLIETTLDKRKIYFCMLQELNNLFVTVIKFIKSRGHHGKKTVCF